MGPFFFHPFHPSDPHRILGSQATILRKSQDGRSLRRMLGGPHGSSRGSPWDKNRRPSTIDWTMVGPHG